MSKWYCENKERDTLDEFMKYNEPEVRDFVFDFENSIIEYILSTRISFGKVDTLRIVKEESEKIIVSIINNEKYNSGGNDREREKYSDLYSMIMDFENKMKRHYHYALRFNSKQGVMEFIKRELKKLIKEIEEKTGYTQAFRF
jgi:hypothetical protein